MSCTGLLFSQILTEMNAGMRKPSVLPLPVLAMPMKSFCPPMRVGQVYFWIVYKSTGQREIEGGGENKKGRNLLSAKLAK